MIDIYMFKTNCVFLKTSRKIGAVKYGIIFSTEHKRAV